MTVAELVAKLQRFDQDAMVAIASETGFNELVDVAPVELVLNKPEIIGSTHHVPNWVETMKGKNLVAICVGPLDPNTLEP